MTTHRVAEQLEATLSTSVELAFLERLLAALPSFEWLDRESGWFWLRSRGNRVQKALRARLAVETRVSLAHFAAALRTGQAGPDPLPPAVVGRMAMSLSGVRLEGDTAVLAVGLSPVAEPDARAGRLLETVRLPLPAAP